ncbi:MAG: aminopeptidase [Acidobacteriota bacterium]|jgi:aminopeptidase|nr:aminopeptidase [Acidobacteriota bacterium]
MTAFIEPAALAAWANYLLDHSLGGIASGDRIMLKGEPITWPLMDVLQQGIIRRGGVPDLYLVPPDNNRGQVWGAAMARLGTPEQIRAVPVWHRQRYESMTGYIEILGAENPESFTGWPPEAQAAIARADEPFKSIRLAKNWVLTLFPTPAFAEIEGMSLEEYTRLVVQASTTDPSELESLEEPIYRVMEQADWISIHTRDPRDGRLLELHMDIAGRHAVKCTGKRNFPDGEVFTSPDARTPEGEIFVDLPVFYNGVTLQGIYLKLAQGQIIDFSAQREMETLRRIIDTDAGSRRIGEVALGMNAGLTRALKHPLFVEKVGGTLHIAIGASYPECYVRDPNAPEAKAILDSLAREGILNRSAQHVDIVVDFRPGGCGAEVIIGGNRLEVEKGIWRVAG